MEDRDLHKQIAEEHCAVNPQYLRRFNGSDTFSAYAVRYQTRYFISENLRFSGVNGAVSDTGIAFYPAVGRLARCLAVNFL